MGDLNEIENEEDRRGKFTATKSKIEDKQLKESQGRFLFTERGLRVSAPGQHIYTGGELGGGCVV